MAFTGKLGTIDSKPGSLEFGLIPTEVPPGGGGYDNAISIVGTATVSILDNMPGVLISGAATVSATSVFAISDTVAVAGVASLNMVAGFVFHQTVNPAASASVELLPGYTYDVLDAAIVGAAAVAEVDELVIGNVSDVAGAASVSLVETVDPGNFSTATGTATLGVSGELVAEESVGISAVASFDFDTVPCEAVAAASVGVAYDFSVAPVLNLQGQAAVALQVEGSISVSVTQSLLLTQALAIKRPVINLEQTLSFGEQLAKVRVSYPQAAQSLVFTQETFRVYPVSQLLNLVQVATPQKVIPATVAQLLVLEQVALSNFVKLAQIVQVLDLLEVRTSYTQLGVTLEIPGAVGTLVRSRCYFVLQAPARAIVLPCPVFGDGEGNNGEVLIKRTVNGDRYSYVRKSDLRRLQYSFSIGTAKRYELLDFLYEYSDQLMTINNHKGEVWRGYLTTNPFAATSASRWEGDRENFNVTLEFEGLRIS